MSLSEKGFPIPVAARCGTCGGMKPIEAFPRHKPSDIGRNVSRCKPCKRRYDARWYAANADRKREYYASNADRRREYCARWRAENPDRKREYAARWRAENPERRREIKARRRARKAGARAERYSRSDLFARWGNTCCYCPAPATDVEHIMPLSRGGDDALHNVVISCKFCNSSKGAKTLAEWALTF